MKYLTPLLLLSLISACGDDTSQTSPTNNDLDMMVPDMTLDVGEEVDMPTVDPDMVVPTDMEPDGLEPDMPTPDMDVDMVDDMEADMPEPDPMVPFTWPVSPTTYADSATQSSFLFELIVPELVDGIPTCCKEFGAISKNEGTDNALATLNETLLLFGADIQPPLTQAIESGSAVILLDHRELDGADDQDNFVLAWIAGEFANGTSYATASAGTGEFRVLNETFVAGTGEPVVNFNPARMQGSQMSAGPRSLGFSLPFLGSSLTIDISEAEVNGLATINANGVSYTDGALSGYVTLESMYGAINTILDQNCGCLGANRTIYTQDGAGAWAGACVADVATLCPSAPEEICRILAGTSLGSGQVCGLLPGVLEGSADIDADRDDLYESLSIGFEWRAANADIIP